MDNEKLQKAKNLEEKMKLLNDEIKLFDRTKNNNIEHRLKLKISMSFNNSTGFYKHVLQNNKEYLNDDSVGKIELLKEVFGNAIHSVENFQIFLSRDLNQFNLRWFDEDEDC